MVEVEGREDGRQQAGIGGAAAAGAPRARRWALTQGARLACERRSRRKRRDAATNLLPTAVIHAFT